MMKSKKFIVLAMTCIMMFGATLTVQAAAPDCNLAPTGQTTYHCGGFNRAILRCYTSGHTHYVCGTCKDYL